jgi:hypothetical protein
MDQKYTLTIQGLTLENINHIRNAVSDLMNDRINLRLLEGILDSLDNDALDKLRILRK